MSSWFPPPSRPRPVPGGLRARSTRGAIAQTWWSDRFIEVLEGIGLGNRLQRGRNYARKGQVIVARRGRGVGDGPGPGQPGPALPGADRHHRVRQARVGQAESALAGNAWYTARLLAGEMPDDIEEVFAGLGLSLFPATRGELSLDCSCPDWAVPCKHLAAAFYLLAESFDDDPFTILAWRGREREDLLANLQAARCAGPPAADRAARPGIAARRLP